MSEAGTPNLKFCEEGHVFDLAKAERCPTCGSTAAGGGGQTWRAADEAKQTGGTSESGAAAATLAGGATATVRLGATAGGAAATAPAGDPVTRLMRSLPPWGLPAGGAALVVLVLLVALLGGGKDPGSAQTTAVVASPSIEVDRNNPIVKEAAADQTPAELAAANLPYGLWEMFLNLGPPTGLRRQVIEIRDNGTYKLHDQVYGHAGRMSFDGRHYTLKSRTSIYEDDGAFTRPDADTIVFEGRFGRTVWTRVRQQPLFETTTDALELPKGVPATLAAMKQEARKTWAEDAVPVRMEIERTKYDGFQIRVDFVSPTDLSGLNLMWRQFDTSEFEHKAVNWGSTELPAEFLDLPEAYAALQEKAALKRAQLEKDQRGGFTWSLLSERSTGGGVRATR